MVSVNACTHLPYQASLMTQLRCGHVALKSYLSRIGAMESDLCQACLDSEDGLHCRKTVWHFLFECPSFSQEREGLIGKISRNHLNLQDIMSNTNHMHALATFTSKTGRFKEPWSSRTVPSQHKSSFSVHQEGTTSHTPRKLKLGQEHITHGHHPALTLKEFGTAQGIYQILGYDMHRICLNNPVEHVPLNDVSVFDSIEMAPLGASHRGQGAITFRPRIRHWGLTISLLFM